MPNNRSEDGVFIFSLFGRFHTNSYRLLSPSFCPPVLATLRPRHAWVTPRCIRAACVFESPAFYEWVLKIDRAAMSLFSVLTAGVEGESSGAGEVGGQSDERYASERFPHVPKPLFVAKQVARPR